jgi:aspartyl-tRNA(Asn)/glutamyl-tRNA(Gln) amidotransferase subunit C
MALTLEEVRKIATLARLRLSPEEERKFVHQLGHIVDYIDQLQRFSSAPPAAATAPVAEAEDRVHDCLPRPEFLANAPAVEGRFLLVPEVKAAEGKAVGGSGEG